jgi:hypothetical protein
MIFFRDTDEPPTPARPVLLSPSGNVLLILIRMAAATRLEP